MEKTVSEKLFLSHRSENLGQVGPGVAFGSGVPLCRRSSGILKRFAKRLAVPKIIMLDDTISR